MYYIKHIWWNTSKQNSYREAYLPDVTNRFGSPGLNRTDITVSVPHSKVFTGWDLTPHEEKKCG